MESAELKQPPSYNAGQPVLQSQPAPSSQLTTQPQLVAQPQPVAQPQSVMQYAPADHQQYQTAPPMQAVPAGPATWQTDLFDCTPCGTCLLGTFLPCILIGQTSDRMRDPSMETADSCNSDCMVLCCIQYFTGCGWVYVMIKRSEIRQRFGIQGSGSADCCTTYWCPCCALIQQEKEVIARFPPVPIAQGYQAQPAMAMPQK